MASTDEKVSKDLIETLEDGKVGFGKAADKLDADGRADIAQQFRRYAEQRASFAQELRDLAAQYGDRIDEDSSLLGALHRGWMSIKDAVAGDDAKGVLDAAEQGEDHAKAEYRDALQADISSHLRTVVERQATQVKQVHDEVKALRDRAA
ncbi:MAG: PA2169 family four-helix-bundle protein [Ilumatobacter sp.]|nr:PA2169 family four-helix-bundle protein [Ilumatobacter sp.]